MNDLLEWLNNPLKDSDGNSSAWRLFLYIGLILVFTMAWGIIFSHIRENIA